MTDEILKTVACLLALAAMVVACLLWVVVQKQEKLGHTYTGVRLAFATPADVVVSGEHPTHVNVAVRASRSRSRRTEP